jgi:hypothetical protein
MGLTRMNESVAELEMTLYDSGNSHTLRKKKEATMEFKPLNPELEESIEKFANERHISTDDALRELVETGLKASEPEPPYELTEEDRAIVAEAMRKVELIRPARRAELAALSKPNESAGLLIGFLKDEPEIAQAIRGAILETRKGLYD